MDRREFLGRVIGIIAGSQIPWVAREFDPIEKDKKSSLSLLRTAIRLMDGTLLEGPGLKDVQPLDDLVTDAYGYLNKVYTFQDVYITAPRIEVRGAVLLSPKGEIIRESDFTITQHLFNGDTLKITLTLRTEGDIKNPEDRHYLG